MRRVYTLDSTNSLLVLFDVRDDDARADLHRQRRGWRESADIEALDENHYVLHIHPGAARELLR
jgi:hypothetical protein